MTIDKFKSRQDPYRVTEPTKPTESLLQSTRTGRKETTNTVRIRKDKEENPESRV